MALETQPYSFNGHNVLDTSILDTIVATLGNDTVNQLVESYRVSIEEILDELDAATDIDDYVEIQRLVHKAKSSSGTLGLTGMFELCKKVEYACREENFEEADADLKLIKSCYEQSLEALENRE